MKITQQEAFNRVWNHFVVNKGKPSYTKKEGYHVRCLYRNGENRCAFGLLIPDDKYDSAWEGDSASALLCRDSFPDIIEPTSASFYDDLQACHDHAIGLHEEGNFYFDIHANLFKLAITYNLTIPE